MALYGATGGKAYLSGTAGERVCVRNSGAVAVVEGVGDHGCEYMTGGLALILGEVGMNFAAGMSGGVAYVYDAFDTLAQKCNLDMVDLRQPTEAELDLIHELIEEHALRTQSPRGIKMLYRFKAVAKDFVKVIPRDYERVLAHVQEAEGRGMSHADALQYAFDAMKEGK